MDDHRTLLDAYDVSKDDGYSAITHFDWLGFLVATFVTLVVLGVIVIGFGIRHI